MLNCQQLRTYIIQPVLKSVELYAPGAEEMLVAICAHESLGGTYIKQTNGPAFGIYQMEPKTHDDLWDKRLVIVSPRGERLISTLGYRVLKSCGYTMIPNPSVMMHNLYYATLMARVFWLQVNLKMPDAKDLKEIWKQYKQYWNTPKGSATLNQFLINYKKFTEKGLTLA